MVVAAAAADRVSGERIGEMASASPLPPLQRGVHGTGRNARARTKRAAEPTPQLVIKPAALVCLIGTPRACARAHTHTHPEHAHTMGGVTHTRL